MKRLITYSIICAITSVLLSSCGSNLSITKRRYSNGYYVDYTKAKQSGPKANQEDKQATPAKIAAPANTIQNPITQNTVEQPAQEVEMNTPSPVLNKQVRTKAISQKSKTQEQSPTTEMVSPVLEKDEITFGTKNINNATEQSGDRHSLLLTIVIIILILWLIGIVAGGLGLGGLINVLLLIALILLILWLLRVA